MALEQAIYEVGEVSSPNGEVNGKVALVDASGNDRFPAGGLRLTGDVYVTAGAGAPVDYTDGTPPATGEGVMGIGSLYVRTDTGKWYTNGGTKAQPLWKLVTSA